MSCTLCSVRKRSCRVDEDSTFHLVAASPSMGILLSGILAEHHLVFEQQGNLFTLLSPGSSKGGANGQAGANGKANARIVELLRQVLSEPERRAISAFTDDGTDFPVPRPLDEWWRVFETEWFELALEEDRFMTWFQPIVDTSTNTTLAHECLIRLQMGRIFSGAEIVDAACVRHEVHRFDSYARSLALRSAARQSVDAVYFVNFMPSSIYNPELCLKTTMQTLDESGMKPANVVFEVVESELVRDPAHLRRICDYYRNRGFGFALDDVGTGSNSLQMVCELRPDFIKLDKSLVQNVEQPMYAATIRKLVELSDQFGVTVIAEGVERMEIQENLWLLGVQCMQGYLFGHPAPQLTLPENDLFNLAAALQIKSVAEPATARAVMVN
jgi:EAL domain-containing protein (putative c-di-GMP-specific phosphodiesterase class I)